jgi:hypothetical protein
MDTFCFSVVLVHEANSNPACVSMFVDPGVIGRRTTKGMVPYPSEELCTPFGKTCATALECC